MYNNYSSSVVSIGCPGPVSFSYNDFNYCISERYKGIPKTSLSSPSCCSCCADSIYALHIRPYFLNGLRQSTLIQRLPYRRCIWGGISMDFPCLRVYDLDQSCYYVKYNAFKTRRIVGKRRGWERCRYDNLVLEERRGRHGLHEVEHHAEVMLSLLTGEVDEQCFDLRERNGRAFKKSPAEKREKNGGSSYIVERKNVDSVRLESKSKLNYESVIDQSSEEGRCDDKREYLGGENRRARGRKEGSSSSSYYSLSSSDEFESDNEVVVEHEGLVEESSSGHISDVKRRDEIGYKAKVSKEDVRHGNYEKEHRDVLEKKNAITSNTRCDWRKKSEKKLDEASFEETGSRNESVRNDSRFSETYKSSHTDSYNQYCDKKEQVSLAVNIDERKREQHSHRADLIGQSETRTKHKNFTDISETHHTDVERTHRSQKHYSRREKNVNESANLVQDSHGEHHKIVGHITRQDEHRSSQQLDEFSDDHQMNVMAATSKTQSEIGMKKRVNQSTIFATSVDYSEEKQNRAHQQVTANTEARGKFQRFPEVSNRLETDYASTSESRVQSDMQVDKKNSRRIEFQRGSSPATSTSVVHSSGAGNITNTQVLSGKVSSSKESSQFKMQSGISQISVDERKKQKSKTILAPPSSQMVVRGPQTSELVSGFVAQGVCSGSVKSESSALHAQTHESSSALLDKVYSSSGRADTHRDSLNVIHHEGTLDSAKQTQHSSTQFISEFAEKVRHDVSTSEIQKEKIYETKLIHSDEQLAKKISGLHGSGDYESREHRMGHASQGSGAKGPSDEMWDVANPSIQESSTAKVVEETAAEKKTLVKRTGRYLWNIIGDIVHLRWASRSETRSPASKSAGRSSPNQSTSSSTWFSGHEPDENIVENVKPQELPSLERKQGNGEELAFVGQHESQGRPGSSSISSSDKIEHEGGSFPSSSSIMESKSTFKGTSPVVKESSKTSEEGASSSSAIIETSFPLPSAQIGRLSVSGEISEPGKTEASGSGMSEMDGEPKRRKLQRISQFQRNNFDEWEEAYRVEAEQRKIDEMFMKEALLDAQKAADNWETPVGAVLVKQGKIIARGSNLVEELRDSTAHAEMICIREASNILHSWRLSETTLYVTLEPCPMCAGAILQARIDTVVWGAPNKLLGADGSWIRLFPNGDGGSGLESSGKPAAPIHPFHPKITIRRGILAAECADMMKQFFQLRRKKKEKKQDPPTTPPSPSCLPVPNHPSKFFSKLHDAFTIMFCFN